MLWQTSWEAQYRCSRATLFSLVSVIGGGEQNFALQAETWQRDRIPCWAVDGPGFGSCGCEIVLLSVQTSDNIRTSRHKLEVQNRLERARPEPFQIFTVLILTRKPWLLTLDSPSPTSYLWSQHAKRSFDNATRRCRSCIAEILNSVLLNF